MTQGTISRLGVYVRGDCARDDCAAVGVLVYETRDDPPRLLCAEHYRGWCVDHPTKQACDNCGSTGNVWRDPVHRRNEYLCIKCHDPESLFQNRWANKVRESVPLSATPRAVCDVKGYGTDCLGEVKPRGGEFKGRLLCNKHAGKKGSETWVV